MSTLRERIAEEVELAWETYRTPKELTSAIMREVDADRAALVAERDRLRAEVEDAMLFYEWVKRHGAYTAEYLMAAAKRIEGRQQHGKAT